MDVDIPADGRLKLKLTLDGDQAVLELTDQKGAVHKTSASLGTLTHPGSMGVYFDQTGQGGNQTLAFNM